MNRSDPGVLPVLTDLKAGRMLMMECGVHGWATANASLLRSICRGQSTAWLWCWRQSECHVVDQTMAGINHWSISIAVGCNHTVRWLSSNGHFSSNPARALRLVTPEVAVRRLQQYMRLRGWPPEVMEHLRLVPSPPIPGPPVVAKRSVA